MYKGRRILLIAPAYNEEVKITKLIERAPRDIIDKILVIDDGSTDKTALVARQAGADVFTLEESRSGIGVGVALRMGYRIAKAENFDIAVTIAGNNKDEPREISRLLDPICDDGCDFVMGSRYLPGGQVGGDMPRYRKLATRLHPLLVRVFTGKRVTESTNGYRALKVSVLDDERINLDQSWLNKYELEGYLLMKLLKLNFRTAEVPVSKIYPSRLIGNTKMRPIIDWWKMLRPIFLVGLGLRR